MDVPKTFLEDVHRDLAHNNNIMAIISVTQTLGNAVCTPWGTGKGLLGVHTPKYLL